MEGVTEIYHCIDWENFQCDPKKGEGFSLKDISPDLLRLLLVKRV